MTEEELAEEYAEGLCKTCTLDTCRNNTLHTCAIKEYIKQAFLTGLKAGKNANEGEKYELSMKITELQELLTDCLFYCYHVDPYYHDCLEEDNIFTRAEKLGVKYNV